MNIFHQVLAEEGVVIISHQLDLHVHFHKPLGK